MDLIQWNQTSTMPVALLENVSSIAAKVFSSVVGKVAKHLSLEEMEMSFFFILINSV